MSDTEQPFWERMKAAWKGPSEFDTLPHSNGKVELDAPAHVVPGYDTPAHVVQGGSEQAVWDAIAGDHRREFSKALRYLRWLDRMYAEYSQKVL